MRSSTGTSQRPGRGRTICQLEPLPLLVFIHLLKLFTIVLYEVEVKYQLAAADEPLVVVMPVRGLMVVVGGIKRVAPQSIKQLKTM